MKLLHTRTTIPAGKYPATWNGHLVRIQRKHSAVTLSTVEKRKFASGTVTVSDDGEVEWED